MARARANPETRERWNASKRERWSTHYGPAQKRRKTAFRERHFFAWRAVIVSRHGEPVTAQQLASLWRQQRGRCALSGARLDRTAEIDHVVARSRGGTNDLANLRWVTRPVNHAKNDMTDEEFVSLCNAVAEWIGQRLAEALR